jgi:hypothetical protein
MPKEMPSEFSVADDDGSHQVPTSADELKNAPVHTGSSFGSITSNDIEDVCRGSFNPFSVYEFAPALSSLVSSFGISHIFRNCTSKRLLSVCSIEYGCGIALPEGRRDRLLIVDDWNAHDGRPQCKQLVGRTAGGAYSEIGLYHPVGQIVRITGDTYVRRTGLCRLVNRLLLFGSTARAHYRVDAEVVTVEGLNCGRR